VHRFSLVAVAIVVAVLAGAAQAETAHAPRYVIYYNSDASPAHALIGLPYTHVILSFLTVEDVTAGTIRLKLPDKLAGALPQISALQADGKAVLLSFGGGDMWLAAYQKVAHRLHALAAAIAAVVERHGFDGVDLDFEISASLHKERAPGMLDGRAFLIGLTRALRTRLGDAALITHAPQAPYLDPGWHGGPYLDVLKAAGDAIDWITVQYYNNPHYDAPAAHEIVGAVADPPAWSFTGLARGGSGVTWPPAKLLVGLPVYRADAANGHLPPATVRQAVVCPLVARFGTGFGGLTGWQFSTLTADHRYWNTDMAGALRSQGCAG
jgi:chitinase